MNLKHYTIRQFSPPLLFFCACFLSFSFVKLRAAPIYFNVHAQANIIALPEALDQIAQVYKVSIIYDIGQIEKVSVKNWTMRNKSVEDDLESLLKGQPLTYKKLNEQTFEYNEKGELSKSIVSHVFNEWQPVEMILEFDSSRRLISRTCPVEIRNFWMKEVYHYNAKGKQIKCDQLKQGAQTLEMKSSQEFAPTLHSGENTPMDIHDPNGLLSIHQFYNSSGTVDRVWKYVYNH